MNTIDWIIRAAHELRAIKFVYTNAEGNQSMRIAEPYRLFSINGNLAVECWQLTPRVSEWQESWRVFRLDRMVMVALDDGKFEPRLAVTITDSVVEDWSMTEDSRAIEKYVVELNLIVADNRVSDAEAARIQEMGRKLSPPIVREIHSRVFANTITKLCADGISEEEVAFLKKVRGMLKKMGYCP